MGVSFSKVTISENITVFAHFMLANNYYLVKCTIKDGCKSFVTEMIEKECFFKVCRQLGRKEM